MLIDSWERVVSRVPRSSRGRSRAEFVDDWLYARSGVSSEDIRSARLARNAAAHRGDEINRATMLRALSIIEKIGEGLSHDN